MRNLKLKNTLFLLLIAAFMAVGWTYWADGDWDVKDGWGGPTLTTSFTDLDSLAASPTYTDWTPIPATFDNNTISTPYWYNAVAADSLFVTVEGRPFGSTDANLIYPVDTLGYWAGSSSVITNVVNWSPGHVAGEYRLKFTPYTSGGGAANAITNDLKVGIVGKSQEQYDYKKYFQKDWQR